MQKTSPCSLLPLLALGLTLALAACKPVEGEPVPDWPDDVGEPIVAAPHVWRWVDFPDSACADGSATGIGVNLSPGATKAFVYFEGGGACWNYETCFTLPIAFHLDGFDEGDFEGMLSEVYLSQTLFDRRDARNPLADAHQIFVPYCTGDVFMGDAVTRMRGPLGVIEREMHFAGAANIRAFMRRLAPTFADVDHIVLSGSSAGGFGAAFHWWTIKDFMPWARVDVLDDSGPPIDPVGGRWVEWQQAWGVELPQGCVECDQRVGAIIEHAMRTLTRQGRFGLMSHRQDGIISAFMSLSPWEFEGRLLDLADLADQDDGIQYFLVDGLLHTFMILGFDGVRARDGLPLWRWVEQMIDGDPAWSSIR